MKLEELFCKLYPEYAVNGKPLSPYFDLFESGYEQAEKRIEGLVKENAELKAELKAIDEAGEEARKHITESFRNKKPYWELEKELTKAKELLKNIIRVTWGEGWNYSLDWKVKAEQFLKDSEGK